MRIRASGTSSARSILPAETAVGCRYSGWVARDLAASNRTVVSDIVGPASPLTNQAAKSLPNFWQACDEWLRRSAEIVAESANALDSLNVFPVFDSDTGSNLKLTLDGICGEVPRFDRTSLEAVVHAAILSAHGNSGAILAEMFTSVCRGLQRYLPPTGDDVPDPVGHHGLPPPGEVVALLLRTVATAAAQAVAHPVAGTILTVADAAAAAAADAAVRSPGECLEVAVAAQAAASQSLAQTPDQLEVLHDAGVVDAGAQAFVLLIDVLVEVLGGERAEPLRDVRPARPQHLRKTPAEGEYEVMYALRGADRESLGDLRQVLSEHGNSVVIAGDETVAQVHVHLAQPGEAVEAALGRGSLSQIQITALTGPALTGPALTGPADAARFEADAVQPSHGSTLPQRTILAIVAGDGLAQAVTSMGGLAINFAQPDLDVTDLAVAVQGLTGEVVILPNDMEYLETADHLAQTMRTAERRIAVIPTVAQVQGLAAMAVHEPGLDFEAAVVGMSTAAGHARHGAVTIAERAAMTMAGRCQPDDVLGIIGGDFVEIGSDVEHVGCSIVARMLASGGELLTLITGRGCPAGLADQVARCSTASRTGLDVEILDGGQQRYLLLIGVE